MHSELSRSQALLNKRNPNPDKAIRILRSLLKRGQVSWMLYHYMGVAMIQKKNYKKALDYLYKALEIGGDEPETYQLFSVVYFNLGEFMKAIEFGEEAVKRNENFLEAWINLGSAYRAMANLDGAMKAYSVANKLDPKNSNIAYRIGSIYFDQGDLNQAMGFYEITQKMNPKFIEAYLGQSLIYLRLQKYDKAVSKIHEALSISPKNKESRTQLAVVLKDWGRYAEAIQLNKQLVNEYPKDGRLRIDYALCLLETGRFNDAEKHYLRALKDTPDAPESLSNYLMGIHYNPERTKEEIFDAHLLWDKHFAPKERKIRPIPKNINRDKKLKIGFISGGFRKHPVGWMITRAIENLPKDQFEVYGYNTHSIYDSLSIRIKNRCDKWTSILGYSDEIIARLIIEDEIDIIVELSGHSAYNRLKTIALEPAPISVKWVGGLFNTSGLQSMDYLLTDYFESPFGEESFYTEKLVRMPHDYVCYEPPEYEIKVAPSPAKNMGYITFGCFNNPAKLNEELIRHWSDILSKVPKSKLLLKSKQYSTTSFVKHVTNLFSKYGVDKECLIFEGYSLHEDLLASYNRIDIALDTWPYSGGLTTCEALWMGVPVVTYAGPTFAGRHSVTHLSNTGNKQWVTESWDEYKAKVIELASNIDQLQLIRTDLRQKLLDSPLCDGAMFGAHLSLAFREMWKQRVHGYENNISENDWQDHINIEPLSKQDLARYYEEHDICSEPAFISNSKEHTISNGLILTLPNTVENFTHYKLIEKSNTSVAIESILETIVYKGDTIIEVGAGYGRLTLPLANMIGKSGSIWSFEPNKEISPYLKETKRKNKLSQLNLIEFAASNRIGNSYLQIGSIEEYASLNPHDGTLFCNTTTIDSIVEENNIVSVKLILVDIPEGIQEIFSGANHVIGSNKPILCIRNYNNFCDLNLEELYKAGYFLFEHIEEVGVLSPIQKSQKSTAQWLFALPNEWVEKLIEEDLIFTNQTYRINIHKSYVHSVQSQAWVQQFQSFWINSPEGEAETNYFKAIDSLWEVDQNKNLTPSKKAFLSVEAARILLDLYTANPENIPVICSLSRAFLNIGKSKDAASILRNAFQQLISSKKEIELNLPFLLPIKDQEHGKVYSNGINWLKVKLAEAWLLSLNDSTYFLNEKEVKLLEQLNGNPDALPIIATIGNKLLSNGKIEKVDALKRKPAGKFVHIIFNHVYAQTFNDLLVYINASSDQEHYLLLEKHTSIENYNVDSSNNDNVEIFDNYEDLDRIKKLCVASDVDAVFFHGIFFDWQRKLIKHIGFKKHINWIMWGGDLYEPIKNGNYMRYLTGFIDAIHTIADGDIKLFNETYGVKKSFDFGYLYPGLYGGKQRISEKQDQPLIVVGNSGDRENNHLEVLKILSEKADIKSYQILLPVAYNLDCEYEKEIVQGIQKLNLDNITTLQKDFIHPDKYIELITSASIVIGAHNRQQAIGNTLASIYGGNKTILRRNITIQGEIKENPSWTFFTSHKFEIQDYEILKTVKSLNEIPELSESQKEIQKHIIDQEFGIKNRANQLINSCELILEEIRSTEILQHESL